MKIDLSAFKQSFLEETSEQIAALERGLLQLESVPSDSEELNAVFRAAHSIKGAAGSLGFTNIAEFTHVLETLLGRIRSGSEGISGEHVSLLLQAVDILRELVRNVDSAEPMLASARSLMERIEKASESLGTTESAAIHPSPNHPESTSEPDKPSPVSGAPRRRVRVTVCPRPQFFVSGLDPLLLFRDLSRLGEFEGVVADLSKVPPLDQIEPEQCYVAFTSILRTSAADEEIRDVFAFVEDTCVVKIMDDASAPVERRAAKVSPAAVDASQATATGSTLRVATEKVDALIDLVGEIVIAHSMVRQLMQSSGLPQDSALLNAFSALEHNTQDLQARVMAIRMVPIAAVFARYPRIVRDLSASLGKNATLEIEGGDTELDKGVVERLSDPLTHLVRNSIDHGLETADERSAQAKPAQGTIKLSARHEAGGIIIEVSDDGHGLNTAKIRAKAEAQGLLRAGDSVTDEQIHSFIFEPGFSTAEIVSDVSGRGVGMDVVKRTIDSLNGSISIASRTGKGTTFRIKLPVTLAILDGLTLGVGDQRFIVPLLAVAESFRPTTKEYKRVVGQGEIVLVRGNALPLIRLHECFEISKAENDPMRGLVVVVESDNGRVGLLVDTLLGQSQVVLKSLEAHYQRIEGVLGATILGDGRVSLILDVPGLVRANMRGSLNHKPADAA
jgi:two-component system chemotaxis sensor kinase CheA